VECDPSLRALLQHDGLRLLQRNGDAELWELGYGDMRWKGTPTGRATINSPELLIRLARAGAGITAVSHHYAHAYVENGELVRVLPEWSLPPVPAWAVFPGRRLMPARTRVFLDALAKEFSGPRCQAKEAELERTMRRRQSSFSHQ
jgi:DNA-binding transcriptional LysR family regulator